MEITVKYKWGWWVSSATGNRCWASLASMADSTMCIVVPTLCSIYYSSRVTMCDCYYDCNYCTFWIAKSFTVFLCINVVTSELQMCYLHTFAANTRVLQNVLVDKKLSFVVITWSGFIIQFVRIEEVTLQGQVRFYRDKLNLRLKLQGQAKVT